MVVTGSGVAVVLKYVGLLRDHAGNPRVRETQLVANLMQMVDRHVIQSVEIVTDILPILLMYCLIIISYEVLLRLCID